MSLTVEPLVPIALWLLLAAGGAAAFAVYARHRPAAVSRGRWRSAIALSALGFVGVLAVLLNPTRVEPVHPAGGRPTLTLLLDATGSMGTTDGGGGQSRYATAVRTADDLSTRLGDRFDVRVSTFGGTKTATEIGNLNGISPDGRSTDLAAALVTAVTTDRPGGQAVVLLSDGIHNAGEWTRVVDAARTAKALACPIYPRTIGGNAAVRDLAIDLRAPEEVAFAGSKVAVPVVVRQRGLAGAKATVTLTEDGKELDRKIVPLTEAEVTEVAFEVGRAAPGVYRFTVAADPLPDEVTRTNNASTFVLRVVDKPVRVLLLEGKPYWDGKFLFRTLFADSSVELDTVVRIGESRFLRRTLTRPGAGGPNPPPAGKDDWQVVTDAGGLPAGADGLRGYQVIVLGRDADAFLTDAVVARVQDWVAKDGGCLVCYRGPPTSRVNQRLGNLLPVRWAPAGESRFDVRLTDRGRDLRWFPPVGTAPAGEALGHLPTLAVAARPERPKPLAVVLATAGPRGDEPAVSFQPYGGGRVVVIEGAGMWRWAFLPPPQQEYDDVYPALWHGLIRWLVSSAGLLPGQTVALRGDKLRFQPDEPAAVTLLTRDDTAKGEVPAVELRGDGVPAGRTVTPVPLGDDPGSYRVVFGPLPEGRYEARVAGVDHGVPGAATSFEVRSSSDELLDLAARPDRMARIADESGGASQDGTAADDLADRLWELWQASRPKQVRRTPAWDNGWVFAAVLGLWAAAWALRRSAGLI